MNQSEDSRVGRRDFDCALSTKGTAINNTKCHPLLRIADVRLKKVLISAEGVRRVPLADVEANGKRIASVPGDGSDGVGIALSNVFGRSREGELALGLLKR